MAKRCRSDSSWMVFETFCVVSIAAAKCVPGTVLLNSSSSKCATVGGLKDAGSTATRPLNKSD